jgi:hypothetical protein
MTSTAETLDVIQHIASVHPRTAPRVDDLEATYTTATIWAELFSRHHLGRDELIAAVSKRAESEECAPEAAEIIKVARETRRDRAERETREELDARQSPNPRAVQGRYQRDDPAGWQYGCPTYDTSDEERAGHRIELENRVADLRKKHPELTTSQAEQAIRERDRDYAETLLTNIKRNGLAALVGGFRNINEGDNA